MKTKALIYCRVSSQRQVMEGHGNSSQEQRCRVRAKEKGYPVEAVFPDDGVSGGLFDRPAMKRLIDYLDNHPTEEYVIIFDDLARFARDLEVHLKLRKDLIGRGAKLECLNFNFEDSPEGIFIENVLASKAQLDRQQNRRQVIQKMKARIENGYWPFMPPLGLVNKHDPIHGRILTFREPYASVIKEAIEKFRDGVLVTQEDVMLFLRDEYKQRDLPDRPVISTVQKILKNPLYAGLIEYEEWTIPLIKAKHEGLISIDTYNTVQERLKRRTKPWKRRDYSLDFPLRPHVLCNACGKPLTGSWNRGRSKRYPNYFCRIKGCIYDWKVTRNNVVEEKFEALLFQVKPANEIIDLTKDVLTEQWGIRVESYSQQRTSVKRELGEVDGEIEDWLIRIRKCKDEELIETYEDEVKKLKTKKKQLEQDLGKELYAKADFGTASEKVFNTLKDPMSMWKSDDYNDKRTILFMYFEGQLRYDYKLGFGTAGLAYPIKLISEIGQAKTASVEMWSSELQSEKF
ncbi:MAG TPA: recombinase family protein [Patescibacteria group bacterium]|nr:recombinase family protein [Patescibacteria group bacterium]